MNEILTKIIKFAQTQKDIQYVIQNGSRVNPSVTPDVYADYDIIFGCKNTQKYIDNTEWMNEFGELLILQHNEFLENNLCWPIFLMQFKSGLRIDLQFYPGNANDKYHEDSLSKILLDKENAFSERFIPSEETYIVRKPEKKAYVNELNDFWWCVINVGKGLARNELTYSKFMYESIVRESFLNIVSWYVSSKNNWNINTGKYGKFLSKYADKVIWERVEKTYYTDSYDVFWESLFQSCELVKMIDSFLRKELSISEKKEDADGITRFLEKIKNGEMEVKRPTTSST